jgi:hypothetical protein
MLTDTSRAANSPPNAFQRTTKGSERPQKRLGCCVSGHAIGVNVFSLLRLVKVTGWRAKGISDLICDEDGKVRNIDSQNEIFLIIRASESESLQHASECRGRAGST